jgi:tryptophan synthase alpha chain
MGRLQDKFRAKKNNVLNVYCTAGYPHPDSTIEVMKALQESGADIVELGIPFSDPLADGPVIQQSSQRALANGMTIAKLFSQLKEMRKDIQIPVVFMGYLNPILQFGFEQFCIEARSCGADGLIIPDLPVFEFESNFGKIIKENELDFIFLITPETSVERIRKMDQLSSGFLYAVSSSSTTGNEKSTTDIETYLKKLDELGLRNPVLVGFGINNKEAFQSVCKWAAGGIIGSAYIKTLENSTDVKGTTKSFLSGILEHDDWD